MTIKELRQSTGMTQAGFSSRFDIPLRTLQSWESEVDISSGRQPASYLVKHFSEGLALDNLVYNLFVNKYHLSFEYAPKQKKPKHISWFDCASRAKSIIDGIHKDFPGGTELCGVSRLRVYYQSINFLEFLIDLGLIKTE